MNELYVKYNICGFVWIGYDVYTVNLLTFQPSNHQMQTKPKQLEENKIIKNWVECVQQVGVF